MEKQNNDFLGTEPLAPLLRRLALRSRLLQTPARRPAARGAEAP